MKKMFFPVLFALVMFCTTACDKNVPGSNNEKPTESFFKSGTDISNYVELKKITDNIWLHISYSSYNGSRTASNGVIAVSEKGLILIDTPWNNGQTAELVKLAKTVFKKDMAIAVITHAHADRIGGIKVLLENGVDVRSTELTAKEAEANHIGKPDPVLDKEPVISYGGIRLETFYPGAGHTKDNIVVWYPQSELLFGGCLIKSLDAKDLGNIEEADLEQWPISVQKVLDEFPDAKIVIPGHGYAGNLDLVKHTLELAKRNEQ